eukprot:2001199-Prymnesium_polylepis.1
MHSPLSGASNAIKCPAGSHQRFEGRTSCDLCVAGTHQPDEGEAVCLQCLAGLASAPGSAQCAVCAAGFFRPHANSPAVECTRCDDAATKGVECEFNATIRTLVLKARHWRHSTATLRTYPCRSNDGGWTPCRGGVGVGNDGDGYCATGYQGPRCELCDGSAYSRYFDKLDAHCHDCGDMSTRTSVILCVVLLLIFTTTVGNSARRHLKSSDACSAVVRLFSYLWAIWREAGMRYKVKVLVGFYQCLAAVPSVYNVQPPLAPVHLTRWIHLIELPSEFERIFFMPTACLGNYSTRIWVGSTWPLVLILACAVCTVGAECVQRCTQRDNQSLAASVRAALPTGLQRVLPLTLSLTFLVLPSTSTRLFRAFLCEIFEYDEVSSRSYLYADLTISCDSDEYESTQTVAVAMLALWPVGVPLLYAVLLFASRQALRTGVPTSLSHATAFLADDYSYNYWLPLAWWETLEMCRKLVVTGWVLVLIPGDSEQARVLVALFVSIGFFGLNLRFIPQRRCAIGDADRETALYLMLCVRSLCPPAGSKTEH